MSATTTAISWCDRTWNVLRGCSRVSTGCESCYAERQAGRFSGAGQPYEGLVRKTSQGYKWTGKVNLIEKDLELPLRWKTPARIFVNSMSDLFHEAVPHAWVDQIMAVMWAAQWHTFQGLTKRAERMHAYMADPATPRRIAGAAYLLMMRRDPRKGDLLSMADFLADIRLPLPNVWLGVSVENQATADARIPWLLKTPAAVRFVSAEPLLGSVDLAKYIHAPQWGTDGQHSNTYCKICFVNHGPHPALDWIIIGGESGPKARPFNLQWGRSIIQQCNTAGVPVWMKQLGARPCIDLTGGNRFDDHTYYKARDRAGADPVEWPEDLRIQCMPAAQGDANRNTHTRERTPIDAQP